MDVVEIKNIKSVIKLDGNKTILRHKVQRLTAPGENYGSLMLKVDLEIADQNEEVHLVAKMLPPTQFMREVFNTDVTFQNENGFYKYVYPLLQNFQKERGVKKIIDFAPRYYGSRLNLEDNNAAVGEDAVLFLENLKIANYVTLDRIAGLDIDVAKLILAELASLHAVGLGLKLQKPQVFNQEIAPFLDTWKSMPDHYQKLLKDLVRLVDNTDALRPFKDQIVKEFGQQMVVKPPREPFATISHNDCWTNNTMVKFEGGKPSKIKIVDYQVVDYGSPAKDVLFFIISSVKSEIVKKSFDDLLKFYHENFISVLRDLKCDVAQFNYEAFLQEIDYEARNSQFGHIAFMLFPVMAETKHATDVAEMTPDNLISEEDSDLLKEKFVFFVNEFVKRKWIYNYMFVFFHTFVLLLDNSDKSKTRFSQRQ